MTEVKAFDMGRFYAIVGTEGRVSGSWQVMKSPGPRDDVHVRPIDVTVWDESRSGGRTLHSDSLTAFVRGNEVDIPERMIRGSARYEVLDAMDEVKAAILAAVAAARFHD